MMWADGAGWPCELELAAASGSKMPIVPYVLFVAV